MNARLTEVNFDGLVGPTHHYGGLSPGNIASARHQSKISHPRSAALQGLAKMKLLMERGIPQGLLPPPRRPVLSILRLAGFSGTETEIIRKAWHEAPELLSAVYSASAMWTANAATVTPAIDSADQRTHFTPANLISMFHRSIEPETTANLLRSIFADRRFFRHHPPLPAAKPFSDEGAANHTRFCSKPNAPGIHFFVFGFEPFKNEPQGKFPARQSAEASRSIARLHRIPPEQIIFAKQSRAAIDAGVFHNDVASVGNENLLLFHEEAFHNPEPVLNELSEKFYRHCNGGFLPISVPSSRLTLTEAVETYLFNSQLISLPTGGMLLLAPEECRKSEKTTAIIQNWLDDPKIPITEAAYIDLRESMKNGGGPACLRLRVPLRDEEIESLQGKVLLTPTLCSDLENWIRKHYRESLSLPDLADPDLLHENHAAISELSEIIALPG